MAAFVRAFLTETFDAILTDPPYGARAGSRKVNEKTMEKIMQDHKEGAVCRFLQRGVSTHHFGTLISTLYMRHPRVGIGVNRKVV